MKHFHFVVMCVDIDNNTGILNVCVCILRLKNNINNQLNVGDCCYISSYFRIMRGANVGATVCFNPNSIIGRGV